MSYFVDKHQVKKIKTFYRALCIFVSLCALLALFSILAFGVKESLVGGLAASLVPIVFLYICIPIAFTGYPPKILMWTLGAKD